MQNNEVIARLRASKGQIGLGRLTLHLETLQQGSWMLFATVIAGVLNYLCHMFVGRRLGPADYGIFAAMNSLSLSVVVVAGVIQTVVTNYVARLRSTEAVAEIGALLTYLLKRLLPWGIGSAVALSLLSWPLATFLQLPSVVPVVVMSLFLVPMAVLPAVNGVQRGLQRFGALGCTQISVAVFRLVVAVGLINLGLGASGAVSSFPISSTGAFVLGMLLLSDVLRQRGPAVSLKMERLAEYSFHAALAMICFTILTNIDVILVKSRFTPTESGLYSAVATLGKITLWLPGAVVMLLFPKAAEQHARGKSTVGLLRKSMLIVCLLCGATTTTFFVFSSLIMRVCFGVQYATNASLLGFYGLAMTIYSLVNVWLNYFLAMREKRYSYVLLFGAGLLLVSLALFGSTLSHIVTILIGDALMLCWGGELLLLLRRRSSKLVTFSSA